MRSFLTIELDTTPPTIDIQASSHAFQGELVEVIITSDKLLDDWHEVYIIDSNGNKHDYNFNIYEDKAYGLINCSKLPFGLSTLSMVFRDDVWNRSKIYSKNITVKSSNQLMYLEIGDSVRSNDINDGVKNINANEHIRGIDVSDKDRNN